MSIFLLGAGFNADAAKEVGPIYGNSIYVGRYLMDVSYPLVADVAQLCFELDQVPPDQSIEELFCDALERNDYAPLNKLSDRLMEADYRLATRLSVREQPNRYQAFFERFAGSNFITFNYDSLPEILLHSSQHWFPHDGYGTPVEVEPSFGATNTGDSHSASLVLHLHGSFCVYSNEFEINRRAGDAISWLEPLGTPRYYFDPYSISHCFPSYARARSSTGHIPIEERIIAPIPDKAQQLTQPFIRKTYAKACSLVRESGTLIAVGYSFNGHDKASYSPILEALSQSHDRRLVVVSPNATKLADMIRGAHPSLKVQPIDRGFRAWGDDCFRY